MKISVKKHKGTLQARLKEVSNKKSRVKKALNRSTGEKWKESTGEVEREY